MRAEMKVYIIQWSRSSSPSLSPPPLLLRFHPLAHHSPAGRTLLRPKESEVNLLTARVLVIHPAHHVKPPGRAGDGGGWWWRGGGGGSTRRGVERVTAEGERRERVPWGPAGAAVPSSFDVTGFFPTTSLTRNESVLPFDVRAAGRSSPCPLLPLLAPGGSQSARSS